MEEPRLVEKLRLSPLVSSVKEAVGAVGVELYEFLIKGMTSAAPIQMSRFTVAPGCVTDEDKHAVHEIWFVAQGKADVCYDSQWLRTSPGDALYLAPWKPHFARNVGEDQLLIFSLWWA